MENNLLIELFKSNNEKTFNNGIEIYKNEYPKLLEIKNEYGKSLKQSNHRFPYDFKIGSENNKEIIKTKYLSYLTMLTVNKCYMRNNIKKVIKEKELKSQNGKILSNYDVFNKIISLKKIINLSNPLDYENITNFKFDFNNQTFTFKPMEFGQHNVVNAIQSLVNEIWNLGNEKDGATNYKTKNVFINDGEDIFLKLFEINNLKSIKSIRNSLVGSYNFEKLDSVMVFNVKLEKKLNLMDVYGELDFQKLFGINYNNSINGKQLFDQFISIRLMVYFNFIYQKILLKSFIKSNKNQFSIEEIHKAHNDLDIISFNFLHFPFRENINLLVNTKDPLSVKNITKDFSFIYGGDKSHTFSCLNIGSFNISKTIQELFIKLCNSIHNIGISNVESKNLINGVLNNLKLKAESSGRNLESHSKYLKLNQIQTYINSLDVTNIKYAPKSVTAQLQSIANNIKCKKQHIKSTSFNRLKLLLESGFKGCQVQTYGSYLSDLSLDESDIDVNFTIGNEPGKDDVELLNKVADYLKESGNYEIENVIGTAKVPIIKFQDKSSKIQFDLCNSSSMATYASLLLREYVKIDKKVKDLILLVKWWASNKDLNSASDGTLSSFCLANMVIHFLQSLSLIPNLQKNTLGHQKLVESKIVDGILIEYYSSNNIKFKRGFGLGTLFYKFITYYLKFNYKDHGISLVNNCLYKRSDNSCVFRLDAPFKTIDSIGAGLKPNKFNNYLVEMIITEYHLRIPNLNVKDLFNKKLSLSSCDIDFS